MSVAAAPARASSTSSATSPLAASSAVDGDASAACSSAGSSALTTSTTCRRASIGIASTSERAAASSTRSVNTATSARRDRPTRWNARSKSESTGAGSRSNSDSITRRPDRCAGATTRRIALVERDRAAAIAELIGREREHRDRVQRRVEHRPRADRRRHQPAGVEQADDIAVSLDPVLIAHRPSHPRGRPPVQLPDVVVGRVLADRLEVGAEAERPARELARMARELAPQAERSARAPSRRSGYTRTASASPERVVDARQAERPDARARHAGERMAPAPARHERAGEVLDAGLAVELERGDGGLAQQHPAPVTRAVAVTSIGVATPRESTARERALHDRRLAHRPARRRRRRRAPRSRPRPPPTPGRSSAASAIAAMIAAVRIVGAAASSGISAGRGRRRSRRESRRRRRTARARPRA